MKSTKRYRKISLVKWGHAQQKSRCADKNKERRAAIRTEIAEKEKRREKTKQSGHNKNWTNHFLSDEIFDFRHQMMITADDTIDDTARNLSQPERRHTHTRTQSDT